MYPDCDPSVGRLGRKGLKNSREAQERYSEKRCEGYERRPYRKPTQVDEERILRPTGEGLLRNSAKLPRNFGRRGALERGPQ